MFRTAREECSHYLFFSFSPSHRIVGVAKLFSFPVSYGFGFKQYVIILIHPLYRDCALIATVPAILYIVLQRKAAAFQDQSHFFQNICSEKRLLVNVRFSYFKTWIKLSNELCSLKRRCACKNISSPLDFALIKFLSQSFANLCLYMLAQWCVFEVQIVSDFLSVLVQLSTVFLD